MRSNQLDHTAIICPAKCVLFNSPETGISASEFQHVVWLILTLINLTPTTTDKIQQQQQQQQTSPRRRGNKRAQTTRLRRLGHKYVFLIVQFIHESSRRPTAANEGQRWPTKRKRGPNDASGIVWALGTFFIFISSCFNIY